MLPSIGAHSFGVGASPITTAVATTGGAGSVFVIVVTWFGAPAAPSSIVDSKGNTFTPVGSKGSFTLDPLGQGILYECIGGTGGAGHTVQANGVDGNIFFAEGLGIATSSPRDQAAAALSDTTSPYLSNPITITNPTEIIFGFAGTFSAGATANAWGNGFTLLDSEDNPANFTGASCYRVVTTIGTYQTSLTSVNIDDALSWIVSYKGAATPDNDSLFFGSGTTG